ncbi:Lysine-specific demethylase 7A [Chionoecetes opilio]|uniref:Lysine-specific demethylase 7A n=1 Tax=Chionoecetes opilio TaxID=41210 RepID=A0A8J5CQC4_CHIOP|nr:Lysine-specific demethylase 7A [Chionoecetes opilio]
MRLVCLANAYALCANTKPEEFAWDQDSLYDWLFGCLEAGKMSRPPVTVPHRNHKDTVWTEVEEVYCNCRLPRNENRMMVVCFSCSKQYHSSCEGVSLHTAGSQMFHCSSCSATGGNLGSFKRPVRLLPPTYKCLNCRKKKKDKTLA